MTVTETQEIAGDKPIALYRLYNSEGVLLYVGITENPASRFAGHAVDKSWWSEVKRKQLAWCDNKAAAIVAEADAIARENPLYNVARPAPTLKQPSIPKPPGRKTSFYLSAEYDARVRAKIAEGVPLREIVRRGVETTNPDEVLAQRVAERVLETLGGELQDRIDRAVERALAKRQGGSW